MVLERSDLQVESEAADPSDYVAGRGACCITKDAWNVMFSGAPRPVFSSKKGS